MPLNCYQLISRIWRVFTTEGFGRLSRNQALQFWPADQVGPFPSTHSPTLKNCYRIRYRWCCSYYQLIPWTWQIVVIEVLGPGRSIIRIFCESHLPDSSSRDFENPNKNLRLASQTKCDKNISDLIRGRIIYSKFYLPGLYFVSSCMW